MTRIELACLNGARPLPLSGSFPRFSEGVDLPQAARAEDQEGVLPIQVSRTSQRVGL